MQIHIDRNLQSIMRQPANQEMRDMIKRLFDEPVPGWVQPVSGYAARHEFYANSFHIQYEIDTSGMETIIRVVLAESL